MTPVFFTDRDLGARFPEVLRAAGLSVQRHSDHFQPDTWDSVWLERVGKEGWTAITHDGRIRYKPNELAAVVRHKVGLLVVVGKAPYQQLAESFVATLPRLQKFLERRTPPFIAKVYRPAPSDLQRDPQSPGSVSLWYPR